jgi:hypothetical protein
MWYWSIPALLLSGVFHAGAAPPVKPMPELAVELSARVLAAQLTVGECFSTPVSALHSQEVLRATKLALF